MQWTALPGPRWSAVSWDDLRSDLKLWLVQNGLWWATSVVVHALVLSVMLLTLGLFAVAPREMTPLVTIDAAAVDNPVELEPLISYNPPPPEYQPPQKADLTNIVPFVPSLPTESPSTSIGDGKPTIDMPGTGDPLGETLAGFVPGGISGGPLVSGSGPGTKPKGGTFGHRPIGNGHGPGLGVPKQADQAIALALAWLARHQRTDGGWSLSHYADRCRDASCTGAGSVESDAAATALGVLPFLATGQTHLPTKQHSARVAEYRTVVARAAEWLIEHQKVDGDLSAGTEQKMYSHALASIALAELYALSHDKQVGAAAQRGLNFIVAAQDRSSGGWRYQPRQTGDTSVTGWQIMALKSGQIAGLTVPSECLESARGFLHSAASGQGGMFAYEPGGQPTRSMTAVGLLASQYLGLNRQAPALVEGMTYLSAQPPVATAPDCYYVYYATQVLHNVPGPQWDTWSRHMRKTLASTQSRGDGKCSLGSWDPQSPVKDPWGGQGGRLMTTALNCLTLQVYYRYLPLYQLDERNRP